MWDGKRAVEKNEARKELQVVYVDMCVCVHLSRVWVAILNMVVKVDLI
jgi:hypothetical protein